MPDPVVLESRIDRVELYRSSALVTRRAEFAARQTGRQRLCLGALPLGLIDASVRLQIEEVDSARVLNLNMAWQLGRRDDAMHSPGQARLRELARRRVELRLEQRREAEALRFFESLDIEMPPADEMPEALAYAHRHPHASWLDFARLARQEISTIRAHIRRLRKELHELEDDLAKVQDETLKESQAELEALAVCRKQAQVELDVLAAGAFGLRLSYLVPAARWAPEYELRVAAEQDEAELIVKALVAQRSGEDWDGVKLAFSTADLERSADLPELESWRIGRAQPARASGWRPLPEGLEDLFDGYDRHQRSLPAPPRMGAPSLSAMPKLPGAEEVPAALAATLPPVSERLRAALESSGELPAEPRPQSGAAPEVECSLSVEESEDYAGSALAEEIDFDDMAPAAVAMEAMPPPMAKSRARAARPKKEMRRQSFAPMAAHSAPMPPPAPAPARSAPGSAPLMEGAPAEGGVTASSGALGFADLRMRGPDASRARGQLEAVSPAERLRENLDGELRSLPDGLLASLAPRVPTSVQMSLPRYGVWPASSAGHFAVRYVQEGQGRVAADGQMHQVGLLRRSAPVERIYRCVPLVDEQVYQVAELSNPLRLALLAGPVRVFRGGDFVVTAPLTTTAPGRRLSVNLGVEPGIRVARNLKFHESTEGLFKGEAVLEHKVEIEVRNNLNRKVAVEIFERVPVSDDEDVKVELLESEPKVQAYDQADRGRLLRGGWRFRLDMEAGQRRKCLLSYRVQIPAKHVLEGGNRRD